jgi:hypothetical protein
MRTLLGIIVVALVITSCTSSGPGRPLNVIVLGQSNDESSITRRVSRRIAGAISDTGHNVYDETLATMDDFELEGRLSRADLLDIARSVSPSMDVAVVYRLTSSTTNASFREVRISIEAFAVELSSGRTRGSKSNSERFRVSPYCTDSCLREKIGDEMVKLAVSAGGAMATRIGSSGKSTKKGPPSNGLGPTFEIKLDGFATWEAHDIEDTLTELKGYRDHRIQFSSNRRLEIWYETTTSASKISRTLDNKFKELGIRANVQFSGSTFKVTKLTLRQEESVTDSKDWEW